MPGKRTYKFLALGRSQTTAPPSTMDGVPKKGSKQLPPPDGSTAVEMVKIQRTPSKIAHEVLTNSVYRHKHEEREKTRQKRRRYMYIAAAAAIALLLLVVIVIVVVMTRGGGNGTVEPTGRWGNQVGLLTLPVAGPNGIVNIRYNKSDAVTYTPLFSPIDTLWDEYEQKGIIKSGLVNCTASGGNQTGDSSKETDSINSTTVTCPPRRAKQFPLSSLGNVCTRKHWYGYMAGNPCIVLALRVPANWDPQTCLHGKSNKTVSPEVNVPVDCQPTTNTTFKFKLLPKYGFHGKTLADRGFEGYQEPLVMLRFMDVEPGQEISLECTVCPGYMKGDAPNPIYTTTITLRVD